jgi:hypothetical protein
MLQESIGPHMLRRTKQILLKQGILKKKHELTVWLKLAPHQVYSFFCLCPLTWIIYFLFNSSFSFSTQHNLYRLIMRIPRDSAHGVLPEHQVSNFPYKFSVLSAQTILYCLLKQFTSTSFSSCKNRSQKISAIIQEFWKRAMLTDQSRIILSLFKT